MASLVGGSSSSGWMRMLMALSSVGHAHTIDLCPDRSTRQTDRRTNRLRRQTKTQRCRRQVEIRSTGPIPISI